VFPGPGQINAGQIEMHRNGLQLVTAELERHENALQCFLDAGAARRSAWLALDGIAPGWNARNLLQLDAKAEEAEADLKRLEILKLRSQKEILEKFLEEADKAVQVPQKGKVQLT
jgi:hypothetical protein